MHKIPILLLFIFVITSNTVSAQTDLTPDRFEFEPMLSYDSNIESPAQYLGYEIGEHFTLYANAVSYFKYLAESSPRVTINEYGETYEKRKLYNLVITSPENHARIDQLKEDNKRLGDGSNLDVNEAGEIIRDKPVFVSYSYNIHGNEASGTEAAMQVSYRFAAALDEESKEILNNAVFIFYICINPDGRDRYVYWYEGMKRSVAATSPDELDHYAPWPNGRTNHYWFDLNRDWIWGIHPESRGHTKEYLKWMPQIHTDYHEQGYNSNYFTMPGTTPRNLLLPDQYEALTDTIGRANAAAFDRHRINYFTRESFDFFYPGYGSSYPSVMNAVGMLTEQGGIAGGTAIETNDGHVLTLRQRAFDHYSTSIATIKKAVEKKELLNRYSYTSSNPANSKTSTKAYLIEDNDDMYVDEVIRMLLHHEVEVHRAKEAFQLNGVKDFRTGEMTSKSFNSGTFIISTNQSKHLFINSILSPEMAIEDSVMYDMSTWSAALAYNLEAYSSDRMVSVSSDLITSHEAEKGDLDNPSSAYAYLIDWSQRHAPKALSELWLRGYKVRAARESFVSNGIHFSPGTLIVLTGRNHDLRLDIIGDMDAIASKTNVKIHSVASGRNKEGYDLASRRNAVLRQPKVAMLVEPPFNTYTCGQLYFLFDQDVKFPVDRIRTSVFNPTAAPKFGSRFGYADLEDYDVLILPGGGNNLSKLFTKKEIDRIKAWISSGGTLVATESAAAFVSKDKSKLTDIELVDLKKDSSEQAKYLSFEDRQDYFGKKRIPGAALNAHIDVSNPLAFGLKKSVYSLKFGNDAIKPDADLQTVGYYHRDVDKLLAAGYASQENLESLAGNTFAAVKPLGSGNVVVLLDNTQYRMFWRGPSRMMINAVMLMPSF